MKSAAHVADLLKDAASPAAANDVARPAFTSRLREHLVATYLTIDPRSLAAGRIALASVLLLDLFKRWVQLGTWYTNEGLVPNHTLLWRPIFPHVFSFFFMASFTHEAVIGFVVCAIAYTALLLGVYTRAAQLASLVCVLALHGRLLRWDNGGDVVLGLLALWTTLLPTGRRFSVDAVLGRGGVPRNDNTSAARPDTRPFVSLGVLALTCQLALIYFFNAIHKGGAVWREGSAVHYVLHLDRLATPLGVWVRERMTAGMSRAMTWSAVATEWTLFVAVASPFGVRASRRLAIALVFGLHVSFGLLLHLGSFVPAMCAFTPFLIPAADWNAFERWWARSARRARFGVAVRARLVAACARAAAALSPGRWTRVAPPGPVISALARRAPGLREWTYAGLIFLAANQLLDENAAAHEVIDHHNSAPVAAAVTYLNLFQGWSMFAPDVNHSDFNLAIDAVTVDGRHVDPWNEIANPKYPQPGATIPAAMEPNWLFYSYASGIAWFPDYHPAFREWILRYPQRTGRVEDALVSYKVYKVEDDIPPPGEHEPTNPRATVFLEWTR